MATKTRKPVKKTNEEIIDGWFAKQDLTVADEARETWEAGQVSYLDYTETIRGEVVVTHCERFFSEDDTRFIVICWDDHGNVTFGGM